MRHCLFTLLITLSLGLPLHAQPKPYITRVYDYLPAPGQFVNASPKCSDGETKQQVIERAEQAICGQEIIDEVEAPDGTVVRDTTIKIAPGLISLGSYGGYVVFGFDHPITNVRGERDFQIFSNAFQADQSSTSGGSCEPGIVLVSRDDNGNGEPDDIWYELAGSDYYAPTTQHGFAITYYRPDEGKPRTPSTVSPWLTDTTYVRWTSNDVNPDSVSGYVSRNAFHTQPYWPLWLDAETLTFTGTKLPCNARDESGNGRYWVQRFFDWGYADNRPHYPYDGTMPKPDMDLGFNIDWAVDDEGTPVELDQIDFIKVYTGILQYCGWVGEISTEICGALDLHHDYAKRPYVMGDVNDDFKVNVSDVNMIVSAILNQVDTPKYDISGDGAVNVTDINLCVSIILAQ